ncbi:hypothetical protein HHK36_001778 [Tetracentron sinense]|uniref:Uncharacterized protein n=1 Tax=Tetracentron sinense TaxID=13715 RepID=A0A834ZY36_TETSI|nr:hypothetical protein HHK36_001778 [Tetracentron sinense]
MSERHEQWIARYGRVYKDASEKEMRFKIFKDNNEFIDSFNSAGNRQMLLDILSSGSNGRDYATHDGGVDQGCEGGLMDDAFSYIQHNHGLTTEANYPYKGVDGTCNTNKAASHAAKINGYEDVPANSEMALLKAVANQPVSVPIEAAGSAFQFYSSRVFTGDCGTDLDHSDTAVGNGTSDDGTKYWLVKYSWETEWGENGYIMMQRDIDAKEGLCGIAMERSYPTA